MKGTCTLKALAQRLPQLYVAPSDDATEAHRLASGRGIVASRADLHHFVTDDEDELRQVETPAGPIDVLFLKNRADFETFLQIVGHKSQPVHISPTIGAITYRGLADWSAVEAARVAYIEGGGQDWAAEFKRLASVPGAFRFELVVVSEGPYSGVDASKTPYDEESWIALSREIRLHHECAHVVCRRTMPDEIAAVWDEVTADATGLVCATGHYDPELAALFLGVSADGFAGGRLAEYLDHDQLDDIDRISTEVFEAVRRIADLSASADLAEPFGFLLELKRKPLLQY